MSDTGRNRIREALDWVTGRRSLRRQIEAVAAEHTDLQRRYRNLDEYALGVTGPNVRRGQNSEVLRGEARSLERDDLARGLIDVLATGIMGAGIVPEPMVLDTSGAPVEEINRELERLWALWSVEPETTGSYDELSAQDLQLRTAIRDGEMFFQHVLGGSYAHATAVPYTYEMVEADRVPLTDMGADVISGVGRRQGHVLRQGIVVNRWGRPVNYRVGGTITSDVRSHDAPRVISAKNMTHAKFTRRIGQLRGVSLLEPVMKRLRDVKEIDDSERRASAIAALFTAVIQRHDAIGSGLPDEDMLTQRKLELVPGTIFDKLAPGEKADIIDSKRPNNNLIAFRASQLRALALGVGAQYSTIARDFSGTYSSQRQELVEGAVYYRKRWRYWTMRVELQKWQRFAQACELANLISIPSTIDRRTLYDPVYAPPSVPWIDPMKEARAYESLVGAGVESRAQIIRGRGRKPSEVRREIDADDLPMPPQQQ